MPTANPSRSSTSQLQPAKWWLAFGLLCWLAAFGVWLVQASAPSDGARVSKHPDAWNRDGALLRVYTALPGGLQDGDRVTAVNGVPLGTWLERLFEPGAPRLDWRGAEPLRYTVLRQGQSLEVSVPPLPQPWLAILAEYWGAWAFGLLTQALAAFVLWRRPADPAARGFFAWAVTLSHFYVWSSYLPVPDLLSGSRFWLYHVPAKLLWWTNWAAALHMALVLPAPLPAVRRRPWLLALPYLAILPVYAGHSLVTSLANTHPLAWMSAWERGDGLAAIIYFVPTVLFMARQYRHRSAADRERIRLVIFTALICGTLVVGLYLLPETLGQPSLEANLASLLLLPFPVAMAIAIWQYRLFDIDLIIRRTLVYAVLTVLLAAVYFGSVLVLQQAFRVVTGQTSVVAVVLSTLAIAALFSPLRTRVQTAIDRRFYRRRHNAQQILASFSAHVRDDVDLDRLCAHLTAVVEEAMEPDGVSLWLKTKS